MIGPTFDDVTQDILRPGFGQPLTDAEQIKLNAILDEILKLAAAASAAEKPSRSELEQIAIKGQQSLAKFFRDREGRTADYIGLNISQNLKQLDDKAEVLRQEVVRNIRATEGEEIKRRAAAINQELINADSDR